MSMEGNPFNRESGLDRKLESEKADLETNSVDTADLIADKDGNFSEKAKLLLARVGKVAAVGVGVAGGAMLLGGAGIDIAAGVDAVAHHWDEITAAGSVYRSAALDSVGISTTIAGIGGICSALGIQAVDKLRGVIDRIKAKHSVDAA